VLSDNSDIYISFCVSVCEKKILFHGLLNDSDVFLQEEKVERKKQTNVRGLIFFYVSAGIT
jgi:hypothetical protein